MKKIGIVGWKTGDNSFGITVPYANYFSQFGEITIIGPTETEAKDVDLLVLPGGPDVDPARYLGENPLSFYMGKQCPFRERFDNVLLPKYMAKNIPIFGICRGHQSFAVEQGAQLKQHMHHESNPDYDRTKLVHDVIINLKSLKHDFGFKDVYSQLITSTMKVNSIHHQIVLNKPKESIVIAEHDSDIEALGYLNYPAFTVQWHPEEIHDKLSEMLILKLLKL